MRYLDLVGSPPPEAPRFFRLVADSPHVDEARLLEWNASTEDALTVLYAMDGDADAFVSELGDSSIIVKYELSRIGEDRFYVLAVGRPSEAPLFQRAINAITQMGLIVVTPVVYAEGKVHFRIVGESAVLQSMIDAIPSGFDVDIHEIGTFPDGMTAPRTVLSERQRAAVNVALELGYYENPRNVTHADIADRLGCAPNTVTEHLQKAEAKLVRTALDIPNEPRS